MFLRTEHAKRVRIWKMRYRLDDTDRNVSGLEDSTRSANLRTLLSPEKAILVLGVTSMINKPLLTRIVLEG